MNMQVVSAPAAVSPVPAPVQLHDADEPIVALIQAYRAGIAAYNASDDESDEFAQATYDPAWRELVKHTPAIVSTRGAVAALRFCFHEGGNYLEPAAATAMVKAVLRFLESAAGAALVHPDAELLALAELLRQVKAQRAAIDVELDKTNAEWDRLNLDHTGLEVRPGEWTTFLGQYIQDINRTVFSPVKLATDEPRDTRDLHWLGKQQIERTNARLLELKEIAARHLEALANFGASSGRDALFEEDDALYDQQEDLKEAIRTLPARSLTGLVIKAQIFKADYPGFWNPRRENAVEVSGSEIKPLIDDILALAGEAQ